VSTQLDDNFISNIHIKREVSNNSLINSSIIGIEKLSLIGMA